MKGEPLKKVLAEGMYVRLVSRNDWEFVERINVTGIVVVVAVTDEGKLLLTDQYREPVGSRVIELPAGLVGDRPGGEHEEMVEAARRELMEETGYDAEEMILLTEGPPSAGLSAETITFYRAKGLKKVGEGGGDESEDIVIHEVPLPEVDDWLEKMPTKGVLVDPKVYAGIYFVKKLGQIIQ